MFWKALKNDPFRLYFPVGWAFSLIAAGLWILYNLEYISHYPGRHHADVMVGGFLFCFIVGFLTTAVPRFTETDRAQSWEIAFSFVYLTALIGLSIYYQRSWFYLGILVGFLFLITYCGRRFLRRKNNPPGAFLFLGLGLLMGTGGSAVVALGMLFPDGPFIDHYPLGQALFYQGMVLALIIGVGSRLVPGIFGWKEIVQVQRRQYEGSHPFFRAIPRDILVGAVLFAVSYGVEFYLYQGGGRILRSLVVTYMVFVYWSLHRIPAVREPMPLTLWGSSWLILLGVWWEAVVPHWGMHGAHILFVGGVGLLTLLIASRVILAHGPGKAMEAKKFPYYPIGFLVILASATRATAHLMPQTYNNHLAYASFCWVVAVLIWGAIFIPKLFVLPPSAQDH